MTRWRWPAAACLLLAPALASAQWPAFRGPDGQGHAAGTRAPLEWSESKNVAWKAAVPGSGWSSPIVASGKVWLTAAGDAVESRRTRGVSLRAIAYDAATGKEIVNVEVARIDRVQMREMATTARRVH